MGNETFRGAYARDAQQAAMSAANTAVDHLVRQVTGTSPNWPFAQAFLNLKKT